VQYGYRGRAWKQRREKKAGKAEKTHKKGQVPDGADGCGDAPDDQGKGPERRDETQRMVPQGGGGSHHQTPLHGGGNRPAEVIRGGGQQPQPTDPEGPHPRPAQPGSGTAG